MKKILENTHKKSNIDLLKVRDYYFEKARDYNAVKSWLIYIPPILLVSSYFFQLAQFDWIDENRDYIINTIAIISFIAIHFYLDNWIQDNLYISNAFRERYDCKVFGIEQNIFAYPLEDDEEKRYLDKARFTADFDKYEVWYGEAFDSHNGRNVICCQMDNIIYTYYVYCHYKKYKAILFMSIITAMTIFSICFDNGGIWLGLMSVFNIIQVYIEEKSEIEEMIKSNHEIMELVKDHSTEIIAKLDGGDTSILRTLQDTIINNRNQSIFIPRYVRSKYLQNDSIFYKELDEYKAVYLNERSTDIPASSDDIEIFNLDGSRLTKLTLVQQRLLDMMKEVIEAFEKENITYALDGGTLIGAMRDQKFVFWDDDIDIAIPVVDGMVERAKQAIIRHCGSQFDVQDYVNDPYYSPRLSNFRIRDKKSKISEKDSPLFDRYFSRGIFIDVYAYSPILFNLTVDKLYRRLLIHPLHKSIKKTELQYPKYCNSDQPEDKKKLQKILKKFNKQKNIYMKRVDRYQKYAKNEEYFVYTPNYITDLKEAGPYIKREDLYGEKKSTQFETLTAYIPANPDKVLAAYYGDWSKPPYSSIEELKANYGENWYSRHQFMPTVLKHLNYLDIR